MLISVLQVAYVHVGVCEFTLSLFVITLTETVTVENPVCEMALLS